MGRALHRESGPSKNGNPVPGDLPFFSFLLFQDFQEGFVPLIDKVTFFLNS